MAAVYRLTKPARECPDEPAYVEIEFERGVPSAVNHVAMPMIELIACLNTIASTHGVGRIDVVEHRVGSSRLREIGEAPAAVLLHAAHRELRRTTAPEARRKTADSARRLPSCCTCTDSIALPSPSATASRVEEKL